MITKREKYLLWRLLKQNIKWYLMANSFGREDGAQKAEVHMEICSILVGFITSGDKVGVPYSDEWDVIHIYTQNILTNKLDEVIGFPIDRTLYGSEYDGYVEKFFDVLIEHIPQMEKMVKEFEK